MKFLGLGTQWAVMLLLASWGGYELDQRTGWKFPVFLIVLPLLALGYSLWSLIRELNKPGK